MGRSIEEILAYAVKFERSATAMGFWLQQWKKEIEENGMPLAEFVELVRARYLEVYGVDLEPIFEGKEKDDGGTN